MTTLNTGCPHLTGVVHNGYEECEMGKACDYDCEWIKLKRAEQKLEKIKEIVYYCKEQSSCVGCLYEDECDNNFDNVVLQIIEGE